MDNRIIGLDVIKRQHQFKEGNEVVLLSREVSVYSTVPTSMEIGKELGMSTEQVDEAVSSSQKPASLGALPREEEETSFEEFLDDPAMTDPADAVCRQFLKRHLEEAMECLNEREYRVLYLRYGLGDGRSRTLREVGEALGVSRQRIRQIELTALGKLHDASSIRKLRDYF